MWLINVETRLLEEFNSLEAPPYAILSHTWISGQEVTFQEMRAAAGARGEAPPDPPSRCHFKSGWQKIDMTCRQALRDRLAYAWVDTCCIDKSSSAELSEAINSMFRWYQRAEVCYVYLSDLEAPTPPEQQPRGSEQQQQQVLIRSSAEHCRWFTRSWTLQELIAPPHIDFFDQNWTLCFTKAAASEALSLITGISVDILQHERDLSTVSVAQKMSWAATRQSTRIEDAAYSLLGIFGIHMPMLYGEEGMAFQRLQTEIIASWPDLSILAWTLQDGGAEDECFSGAMASAPSLFRNCGRVESLTNQSFLDFSMSNRGIRLRAQFGLLDVEGAPGCGLGCLGCGLILPVCKMGEDGEVLAIEMRNIGRGCFVRQHAGRLVRPRGGKHLLMLDPVLLTRLPVPRSMQDTAQSLVSRSRRHVLEVVLPRRSDVYRRWPWQQWDENDTLFFAESPEDVSWSALKIVAYHTYPDFQSASGEPVDFLFYAFGWNSQHPQFTLHRVHGTADDRTIQHMNDEAVRDGWKAYWVKNRLRLHKVPDRTVLVAGTSGNRTLLLKSSFEMTKDSSVCAGSFWRVTFGWEIVLTDEITETLLSRS